MLGLVSQAGLQSLRPSPAEVAEAFTVPLAAVRLEGAEESAG